MLWQESMGEDDRSPEELSDGFGRMKCRPRNLQTVCRSKIWTSFPSPDRPITEKFVKQIREGTVVKEP